MTEITYRDAVAADAGALDAMAIKIWRRTFGQTAAPEDIAAYLAKAYGPQGALIADLVHARAQFRLALAGDRIVGYAKINRPWLPDAEAGAMQLSQLYVAHDFHGAGVAPVLMDWAEGAARALAATALLLTVWENNHRAARFYRRRGFVHIGDYEFPVGSQIDTDHIMRLAL